MFGVFIMVRHLYLVGYDVGDDDRQDTIRNQVKNYAFGGQLSAYECYLTNQDKIQLQKQLNKYLAHQDAGCVIQVHQTYWQTKPRKLPIFNPTNDFLYIG